MNCLQCHKIFGSKQALKYHVDNNVCDKNASYHCNFCKKKFSSKYNLTRHSKTCKGEQLLYPSQIPHKSLTNPSQTSTNFSHTPYKPKQKSLSSTKETSTTHICLQCSKSFSRKDNLHRHMQFYCTKMKDYSTKIKKLEKTISDLKTTNTTITNQNKLQINNTNIHTNINQNIKIQINNLGNEDISSISNDEMHKIVDRCYNALKVLTKRTHIDIPENRNVYIPSYKDGYALVYNRGKWEFNDLNSVLQKITSINIDRIHTYYEDNVNNYPLSGQNHIGKMLEESLKGDVDTKYIKDIKMLLLNNRNIIKQSVSNKY